MVVDFDFMVFLWYFETSNFSPFESLGALEKLISSGYSSYCVRWRKMALIYTVMSTFVYSIPV